MPTRRVIRLAMALLLVLASRARAGGFNDLLKPPINADDHAKLVVILHLDEDQRAAARILFEGYLEGYSHEAAKLKELHERRETAVRAKGDDAKALSLAFFAAFSRFSLRKDGARREYMADLRAVLTPVQREAYWAAAERYARRKLLPRVYARSASSWHEVDVASCVGEAGISGATRDGVAEVLDEYETGVDAPLRRLEHLLTPPSGEWADEDEHRLEVESRAIGRELADINRKYARWIADLLPPIESKAFARCARVKAYGPLGTVSATRERTAVLRGRITTLDDLSAEQPRQVEIAFDALNTDLDGVEKSIILNFDQADARVAAMSDEEWLAVARTPENPCDRARSRAFELCDDAGAKLERNLRALLTEPQQAVIWPPKK